MGHYLINYKFQKIEWDFITKTLVVDDLEFFDKKNYSGKF